MIGLSLLMVLYFLRFFLLDVYSALTGEGLIKTTEGIVINVLINEPVWFAAEVVFVLLTTRSLFRERVLEG